MNVILTGNDLSLNQVHDVARAYVPVVLAGAARRRMTNGRRVVDELVESDRVAYGINTGFGKLAAVRISPSQLRTLQINLIRSHACGVGERLSELEARAMMILRANALAKGFSGVRPVVVDALCALLNARVYPQIPSQGSVGASGDLAPLAHLAQVLIGEGEAIYQHKKMPGGEALEAAGIEALELAAKEGLALINGTQAMQALIALALRDAEILVATADLATALSLDAVRGTPAPFDDRIARVRPHQGHCQTAHNLRLLNQGSTIRESHRSSATDKRVQDPYSFRCVPQVHGAARDAIAHVRQILEIEINSATDNPLIFESNDDSSAEANGESGDVISGGNFHGQPLAMAADQLALAIATLAGISERRIEQMMNGETSGQPAFLASDAGLNSGFMILQVTAAALASETKALAAPHSIDSIPTSANQEDYVSMGMGAARRLRPMIENLRNILAIELLAACQGIDYLRPLRSGSEAEKGYDLVRSASPDVKIDRSLSADIAQVAELIERGRFARIVTSLSPGCEATS